MLNRFLTAKEALVASGEIRPPTFAEYHKVAERIAAVFGLWRAVEDLRSEDFERLRGRLAKQYSAVRLANEVQRVRTIFKFAYESGLIDRPVRFGPAFKKPSAKVLRLERAKEGLRLFIPMSCGRSWTAADMPMKAKILLGVNRGYGNTDVANLRVSALDLTGGWVDYPRPKTGVPRRCRLWTETVTDLRDHLATRPAPLDPAHNDLVFIGRRGKTMLGKYDHWRLAADFETQPLHELRNRDLAGTSGGPRPLCRRMWRTSSMPDWKSVSVPQRRRSPAADQIHGVDSVHKDLCRLLLELLPARLHLLFDNVVFDLGGGFRCQSAVPLRIRLSLLDPRLIEGDKGPLQKLGRLRSHRVRGAIVADGEVRARLPSRPCDATGAGGGPGRLLRFYNEERLHAALDYLTPKAVYAAA